jgi:Flp pilus assembly protein TadG
MFGFATRILSWARARRYAADEGAIAAVEFALVLPLALLVILSLVEARQALSISRKVTITTRTVTDLTTQYASLSKSALTQIMAASSAIIAPIDASKLGIVISEVSTDQNGNATVTWSQPLNATPLKTGAPVTLPSGLARPNVSMIMGQVYYSYTPPLVFNVLGSFLLSDQLILMPRLSNSITLTN